MHAYITDPMIETGRSGECEECAGTDGAGSEAGRERVLDTEAAKTLAGIFRALGDPTRLRLISLLAEREMCVGDLTAALGMEQPAVSHQLSDMRELQLVRSRRQGRHIYYRLDDEHVRDLFGLALAHVRHTHDVPQESLPWIS